MNTVTPQAWNHVFAHHGPMAAGLARHLAHTVDCPTCAVRFIDRRTTPGAPDTASPMDAALMLLFAVVRTNDLTEPQAITAIAAGIDAITTRIEAALCGPPPTTTPAPTSG